MDRRGRPGTGPRGGVGDGEAAADRRPRFRAVYLAFDQAFDLEPDDPRLLTVAEDVCAFLSTLEPQLGGGAEPAGLNILDLGVSLRIGGHFRPPGPNAKITGRMPITEAIQQFAQPCADEMVFQPPFFKPEAGSGEV